MTSSIHRGDLTAYLISVISPAIMVGDAVAPAEGGWDDDPNDPSSSYVPYVVMTPQTSGEASGSLGDSNFDHQLPYSFTFYGVSRDQVEFYADKGRDLITNLARERVQLSDGEWKVQQTRCTSIGGVARTDNSEPSEFAQTDVIVLYMSKEI